MVLFTSFLIAAQQPAEVCPAPLPVIEPRGLQRWNHLRVPNEESWAAINTCQSRHHQVPLSFSFSLSFFLSFRLGEERKREKRFFPSVCGWIAVRLRTSSQRVFLLSFSYFPLYARARARVIGEAVFSVHDSCERERARAAADWFV